MNSETDRKTDLPTVSIVIPAYNERGNLRILCSQLQRILAPLNLHWEIVIVDDGSSDSTWEVVKTLNQENAKVRGVRLSRNFGHQNALIAGLMTSSGDAVISIDADLQHPPDVIPLLIAEWQKGNKIVKTIRRDTKNSSAFKRFSSKLYYRLFSYLSGVELDSGMADFRLLDRQVLDEILQFKEGGLFLRGLVQWVGYPSSSVVFECGTRHSGASKYTLVKMLKFAWHGISSFSLVPLRVGIIIGLGSSAIAFLSVVYAILSKLLTGATVSGWTSSVAIISFLFGTLFAFLAILAEYIGRILEEVRDRPRFIVSEQADTANVSTAHKRKLIE